MRRARIAVLGSGVICNRLIKELVKKGHVSREIPKREANYIFYITEKPDIEQFKEIRAKLLFVIPKDTTINIENKNSFDVRVVKLPAILFKNQGYVPLKYLKQCADIIMNAMFGQNTRDGLFILPEPPFNEAIETSPPKNNKKIIFMSFPLKKVIIVFLALFTTPVLVNALFIGIGFLGVLLFQISYFNGETERSEQFAKVASFAFDRGQELNRFIVFPKFDTVLKIGSSTSDGALYLARATKKLEFSLNGLDLNNIKLDILAAQEEFTHAGFLLSGIKTNAPLLDEKIRSLEKTTANASILLGRASSFLGIAPELFGENGKKTYLVLLQNSNELRATGGFIGSYGILTFENGQLLDFLIFDVYTADGQLKGHVEPPLSIKRYLEQPHWYLRDSNWDPDFEVSGARAVWFLEKEIGTQVDGVVGVDTHLASSILEAIGDVYLPDYQETITPKNLAERANYWAHKDFFAGSTAKRDFLSSLTRAIFDKLQNDKNISWQRVLLNLVKGANEKHLMFIFNDPQAQYFFTQNGLSGSLKDARENNGETLNDFLMVVDSNLGVNKVNYFIQRKISQEITIAEEGTVTIYLKIDYINSSPKENYKNYLRILTPKGARIKRANFSGEEIKEINTEETDKTTFGFLVAIPAASSKTVTVEYELENKMPTAKGTNIYSLKILKQPGTLSDPLTLTVSYPNTFTIGEVKTNNARVIPSYKKISISSNLLEDREFSISFLNK